MRVIIVGAGPTGLLLGAGLARRGHEVVAFDRDPGPADASSWPRRGVMQFEHPHGFRQQVPDLLAAEWPDALATWLDLGGEPRGFDGPDGRFVRVGIASRRSTFERALRTAAASRTGLAVEVGTVEGIVERAGRVTGVVVEGRVLAADLVVDATGRGGRVLRGRAGRGGRRRDCGIAYVTRTYRRHPGVEPGPLTNPVVWGGSFAGYDAMVFPHEDRHLSVVFVRSTEDDVLTALRHDEVFEEACHRIPAVAAWTEPELATPTSRVLVGGALRNSYRPQLRRPGLVAVGDAVATTTPTAGRGVALCSMQIAALLALLDDGADPAGVATPFGRWCDEQIRPWVDDHIDADDETARRLRGIDIDLRRPLTSRAIVAAAGEDPAIGEHVAGFLAMTAPPASVRPAEPLARAVYETGWRPPFAEGPGRIALVAPAAPADRRPAGARA